MSKIRQEIESVIRREGGYVNHPDDRGGPTNYGITQSTLSAYLGRAALVDDVKNLSRDLAVDIYEQRYYTGVGIHRLPETVQPFVFDSAVNHGPRRAIKFIQSVCSQAGYLPELTQDGAIGPNTLKGAQWAEETMGEYFLKALVEERRNYYYLIVENNPSQEKFLKGWLNRISEFDGEVA